MKNTTLFNIFAGVALAATGAVAQELPVFDDAQGFEIVGVVDEILIVQNAGAYFACEVEEYEDQLRIQSSGCLPIVGESNSSVPYEQRLAEARAMIENAPTPVIVATIAAVMEDEDCVLDISDEDAMEEEVIRRVALKMGLEPDLIGALREPLYDVIDDGFEAMMDQGRIFVNESLGRVLLTDC